MRLLITAATRTELRACQGGIRKGHPSESGHEFDFLLTGVGPRRAESALVKWLTSAKRLPDLIVSSGFAGGLTDSIDVGTWVTADQLWIDQSGKLSVVDWALPAESLWNAPALGWVTVAQLGTDSVHELSSVAIVDMECAALARAAHRWGIPFLPLRVITDTPLKPLPEFMVPVSRYLAGEGRRYALTGILQAVGQPAKAVELARASQQWCRVLSEGWCQWLLDRNA